MKRKSIAGVIMPIVLILLLFFLLSSVIRVMGLGDLTYSQVVELFESEKVKAFVVQDDTIELELWEPEDGRTKLSASVSTEVLREDLGQLFLEQRRSGKLESYAFLPDTSPSVISKALPYAIAGLALLLIWGFMNRRANASPGGNFTMARTISATDGGITFRDVAGCDEEKQELMEVVDFLRNPEKYHQMGATVPKGILLVGPPGTGKTLLARAVAGETNASFLSISGSDFMELYVGVGASRVRDLFQQAKQSAPSIIFIDEIDAVGRQRGAGMGGGHDEREQTLNQLLVEMDGFGPSHNVVVLAATNREDILDPALLRPGRFDRQIYVGYPDANGREEILRIHTRNKRLDSRVDLRRVAMSTSGFTGADLKNLMNEAAILAVREDATVITGSHIHEAMMKTVAGPEKRSRKQLRQDLEITAIHEAGHAVVMYHLATQDPVHQISIIPRGRALGVTISLPVADTVHMTRNQMYEQIVSLLGGRVAESLFCQDISTGASNDIQRATKLARDMVARYGMSERIGAVSYDGGSEIFVGRDYEKTKNYSEQVAGNLDSETKALIDGAYEHCTRLMRENEEKVRRIAQFLLENETMTGIQFQACMEGKDIPPKEEADLFSAQP